MDISAVLRSLIAQGDSVLLALSGGADSMVLLHMLLDFQKERHFALRALHVEHGIRGAEALGDAEFVRGVCEKAGIAVEICHIDVPAEAKKRGSGLEETARHLRHGILREAAQGAKIALAHHADDQAESVLLHILRGSGMQGALGMHAHDPPYIRPLLEMRAAEIRAYARERGIDWREDSTNADMRYARNRMRGAILPEMEKINPQAVRAICRFSGILREQEDWLKDITEGALEAAYYKTPYGARLERGDWPDALARRILRRALETFRAQGAKDVEYRHIDALLSGETLQLPGGLCVLADARGWCFLGGEKPPRGIWPLHIPGRTICPTGRVIIDIVTAPSPRELREKPPHIEYMRRDALEGAVLRYRNAGDRFQKFGGGSKKLKDFFIDSKIEKPLREYIPIIARENDVLWIAGLGIARETALSPQDDQVLRLRYIPYEDK